MLIYELTYATLCNATSTFAVLSYNGIPDARYASNDSNTEERCGERNQYKKTSKMRSEATSLSKIRQIILGR